MNDADDLPVKIYQGEPADVAFLKSLLESAGIHLAGGGLFFGPGNELFVRKGDEEAAREILNDFENRKRTGGGHLLPGPWKKQ